MIFGGYNHIKKMYLKSPHKIDRKFWVYSTELYLFIIHVSLNLMAVLTF